MLTKQFRFIFFIFKLKIIQYIQKSLFISNYLGYKYVMNKLNISFNVHNNFLYNFLKSTSYIAKQDSRVDVQLL